MSYETRMLEKFILDYKQYLENIEESYKLLNDERGGNVVKRAFKADVIDLLNLINNYTAFSLKMKKVNISEMSESDRLLHCASEGMICKDFYNISMRCGVIHEYYCYRETNVYELINFYENAKGSLYVQLDLLVSKLG